MLRGLVGVVPEKETQAARRLEHLVLHGVDVLVLTGEHAVDGHAPAVVDQAVRHRGEALVEELDEGVGAGMLAGVAPVDVVPEDVGGEAIDELAQLRGGVWGSR